MKKLLATRVLSFFGQTAEYAFAYFAKDFGYAACVRSLVL
jgi:hypothetical protein